MEVKTNNIIELNNLINKILFCIYKNILNLLFIINLYLFIQSISNINMNKMLIKGA